MTIVGSRKLVGLTKGSGSGTKRQSTTSTRSTLIASVGCKALAGVAMSMGAFTSIAAAQDDSDADQTSRLGTITVTATRVEESLQDVPISITALSSEQLDDQNIETVVDLAASVPNVSSTNGPQGGSDANFFVRGVGQFDFIITNDPAVGIYVDGVYLGRTVGALLDTGDVERIEVLRGPQGTLFGRNTIGGAINVTTQLPNLEEFEGSAKVTAGDRDRFDVEVGFSAPLSDTFGVRLFAQSRSQEGWATRPSDGATFGDFERVSVSGSALWQATPNLRFVLRGDFSDDGGSPNPQRLAAAVPGFGDPMMPTIPTTIFDTVPGQTFALAEQDPQLASLSIPADRNLEAGGISLTSEWDAGLVEFKSITAYRTLEGLSYSDNDGSYLAIYDQSSDIEQSQFSQEFQLLGESMDGRVDWLTGVYYFQEEATQIQQLCLGSLGVLFDTGPGTCVYSEQDNDQDVESVAIFGNLSFDLTDRLTVNLGARYTEEEKDITTTQGIVAPVPGVFPFQFAFIPALIDFQDSVSFDAFNPKIGLEYKASDNILLYASYAQGYRSGGFNGRVFPPSTTLVSFEPDENNTYEIGFKGDLFDNHLRLNAAAFVSEYEDIQQTVTDPVLLFFIANAAEGELTGFELEATAVPMDNLLIQLGLGYTDSEFTEVDPGLIPARINVGNQFAFSPEWQLNVSAQYDFDLGEHGSITPRFDYSWQDDVFVSPANQPNELQEAYGLLNLQVKWLSESGKYAVSVFGKNVTDEEYDTFGQDATFNQGVAFRNSGKPSEWGVSFDVNF